MRILGITIHAGKTKGRSQMMAVFTIDGRDKLLEIPVTRQCAEDIDHEEGYLLSPANQYQDENNNWIQPVYETCFVPIDMQVAHNMDVIDAQIDKIYHECSQAAQFNEYMKAAKNWIWERITWIVAMGLGSVVIIAISQIVAKRNG